MSQQEISHLMLLTISGPGLLLMIAGLIIRLSANRKAARCTASAKGKVINYYRQRSGGGSINNSYVGPLVEFTNEKGNTYKVKKKFGGVKYSADSRRTGVENVMWEDSKGILHIVTGKRGTSEWAMAEKLWPIGSEMTVRYDPEDPGECYYIDKPVKCSILTTIFILAGAAVTALGIIMSIFA